MISTGIVLVRDGSWGEKGGVKNHKVRNWLSVELRALLIGA